MLIHGMPKIYGCYWFRLRGGLEVYGYYAIFHYPYNDQIRIVDLIEQQFYYVHTTEILGYIV